MTQASTQPVRILVALALAGTLFAGVQTAEAAQNTKCSTLNTVCATAVAEAIVSCGTTYGMRHCTPAIAGAGHGASPTKLDGSVSWRTSSCGGLRGCTDSWALNGGCSWSMTGQAGCGTASAHQFRTNTCFLCTTTGYAYAYTSATASSKALGSVAETVTSSAWAQQYRSHC